MKCYMKNIQSTPRKMALAANLIRGLTVQDAIVALKFQNRKACALLLKGIQSAAANAKNKGMDPMEFLIDISVGRGMVLKRFMARARSKTSIIEKAYSNININLINKIIEKFHTGAK